MGLRSAFATAAAAVRCACPVVFLVGAPMAFFFIDRLVALSAVLEFVATPPQRTKGNRRDGLLLGAAEDLVVTMLLIAALFAVEVVAAACSRRVVPSNLLAFAGRSLRVLVVFTLVVLAIAPFAADMLLLRTRDMRFTMDLIVTYSRERDQATKLEVDPREVRLATETIIGASAFAVAFTIIYLCFIDLRGLLIASEPPQRFMKLASSPSDLEKAKLGYHHSIAVTDSSSASDAEEDEELGGIPIKPTLESGQRTVTRWRGWRIAALTLVWLGLLVGTYMFTHSSNYVVSATALNATLNELFRNVFGIQFLPNTGSGDIESVKYYLEPETETYELFRDNVLYRKTTGFQGPLAFDVKVDEKNPPNVLILAVESFRYMDSLLMAANTTAGELMQKSNLTVTPQFDKWASRGIAFNNMWSSWQTSRSLEAILFGQVAYDSVTNSGTTYGREHTRLVGLPQLFKQKGYETVFTTGCIVTYDQWDTFLPSHGFETVMAAPEMKTYAEQHYNINKKDWDGHKHRGFMWGVHDDVSFEIIGDIMINKTKEQAERVERGEPKQPFFMNHYTISSHHTFEAHPTWLDSEKLPDFSPLCEGWNECDLIKRYAKLRYFTDMELGKFLDRMKKAGVLDDTIIVIVGDHGQSPEFGLPMPYVYQTAVTHVASTLIAEGRLGEYAGMIFDDAAHHYDLLNTLADIVGVPKEGFLQTGVGRSLKRKIPFGERLVWSNNPMKKMSVVRGHQRYVYDRTASGVGLFDTIKDPLEKNDLLPALGAEEAAKYRVLRRKGRELNTYFKDRWDKKCLAQVSC